MTQANHEEIKIKGFNWDTTYRPYGQEDLFSALKKRPKSLIPDVVPVSNGLPNKGKATPGIKNNLPADLQPPLQKEPAKEQE
jgi:hypothetical protein